METVAKTFQKQLNFCHCDDLYFIIITQDNNRIIIRFLNKSSLAIEHEIEIESSLCGYAPHIDHSCIYLPTALGQILTIDKYSGTLLNTSDIGYMQIASDVVGDEEKFYAVCDIPLSSKLATARKKCLCSFDKLTGKKITQSQSFDNQPVMLAITLSGNLLVVSDSNMISFTANLEINKELEKAT